MGAAVDLGQRKVTTEQMIVATLHHITTEESPSRENSLAVTKLEEALLWHRHDRGCKAANLSEAVA